MSAFTNFASTLQQVVQFKKGKLLQQLLSPQNDQAAALIMNYSYNRRNPSVNDFDARLAEPWPAIATGFLQTYVYEQQGDSVLAQKEFKEVVQNIIRFLDDNRGDEKSRETDWMVQLSVGAANQLKRISESADNQLARSGRSPELLSDCVASLQDLFRQLSTSKTSATRRVESVGVACVMMKAYFKLNTFNNNCKQLISNVESMQLLKDAPAAYRATMSYYIGRLAAYDEDFPRAERYLSEAFRLCLAAGSGGRNLQRVLRYLIPVRLLLGVLPSAKLLAQYRLPEYTDICTAVRTGDMALLTRSLAVNQIRFIKQGTYLVLEKLQVVVYRSMLKRRYLAYRLVNPTGAHQLPMNLFEEELERQGLAKDPLEVQCVLVNLICRGYVKGYLALEKKKIVLAKADPFPSVASATLSNQ